MSRLPGVWPAYLDNKLYYFDDGSLSERQYYHTSNYGMVPLNVSYSTEENADGSITYKIGCEKTLSWYSFSKLYYFFVEYYNLLKQYGHCNRIYTSAEDYYNYESADKYADQMIYGTNRQTYIDLDNEFADNGGIVKVKVYNKVTCEYSEWKTPDEVHDENDGDKTIIVDVTDGGFYKWICENVVPSFEIPMDYTDYWHSKRLYYPDVVKWLAWFKDRNDRYAEATDCKNTDNCCECDEYKNRGGYGIFTEMKTWYDKVNNGISGNTNAISGIVECQGDECDYCLSPTIIEPISIYTYLDDFGEFSIFSKEYELGIDYRTVETTNGETATTVHYDGGNAHSGTVVTMEDGSSQILTSGSGFSFIPCFMEKVKDDGAWKSYTERYVEENEDDFKVNVKYFTYDINNVRYTTSAETESEAMVLLEERMAKKYPIIEINGYLIGGTLYERKEIEYAIYYDENNKYMDGKKYVVMRDNITNTPYVYINGNKVYAEFYQSDNVFYFTYFKKRDAKINKNIFDISNYQTFERFGKTNGMYYIDYDGAVITVEELDQNGKLLNGNIVIRVIGYTANEDGTTIYVTDAGRVITENLEELDYVIEDGIIIEKYAYPITLYPVNEITGKTVSKLIGLMSYNMLVDDIGNRIDGIFSTDGKFVSSKPIEGSIIEPLYHVGNTANISRFKLTEDELYDVDGNKKNINHFVGNIITRMKFYYKDTNGEPVDETVVDVVLNGSEIEFKNYKGEMYGDVTSVDSLTRTSLTAIKKSTDIKETIENDEFNDCDKLYKENGDEIVRDKQYFCLSFMENIFCDVTYNIGATLSRVENKNFILAEDMDHGVEYTETVRFVKENREYYLKKPKKLDLLAPFKRNKPESHSISYPIFVYKMVQDETVVEYSQYGTDYSVPMANFKFNILTDWKAEKKEDMTQFNNTEVYPTFREEYRLGSSVIENIDTDIYIERGINAAYERHLKLGEVVSLENLERYGNGYFKMQDS